MSCSSSRKLARAEMPNYSQAVLVSGTMPFVKEEDGLLKLLPERAL